MSESPRLSRYVSGTRQRTNILRLSTGVSTTSGSEFSLWRFLGNPGPGAIPPTGVGEIPTNATAGSLPFTNGVNNLFLELLQLSCGRGIHLCSLYERTWHNSGLNSAITTLQSVDSGVIARGDGLWLEVYTQAGGGVATTATVVYVNSLGTTGRVATVSIPASAVPAGRVLQFQLQQGDIGVSEITSFQMAGTMGGATGNLGLTVGRELAVMTSGLDGTGQRRTYFKLGGPRIYNDSCLALRMMIGTSGTMGHMMGAVGIVDAEL